MVGRVDVLTHLLFQDGRAREAAGWYVSLVPRSRVDRVIDDGVGGATVHFTLADRGFIAFDSPVRHQFDFTPSMSHLRTVRGRGAGSSSLRPDRR
jgi:predicted 3-demethylubiquinone-9 3-methyltransferase (glyoxalase superfamily)